MNSQFDLHINCFKELLGSLAIFLSDSFKINTDQVKHNKGNWFISSQKEH